ncbi:histidine phosphatase family protein [Absicoccus porci]|uniref:Histidine phosphatase family protein n=1 Tax=Absicoccus porci TaxID=2486576 RepID=A0A3N0HY51_9FIRM|nr:histidine phosphatase family protein [Absicoccus porci]RNM29120.1 histidine phosphatase family protein [Absicoccus porci]
MTRFYVVRHGKTLFNKKGLYQGWCDSPLQPEGIQQAKEIGAKLMDKSFSLALSSTSERAMDTMHYIIANRGIPYKYEKGLREVFFGKKEGDPFAVSRPDPEQDWIGFAFCGGENRDDARARFMHTLEKYADQDNVLVVSHGAVIARTIEYLRPDIAKTRPHISQLVPNCSLTIFDYQDNQWQLIQLPQKEV